MDNEDGARRSGEVASISSDTIPKPQKEEGGVQDTLSEDTSSQERCENLTNVYDWKEEHDKSQSRCWKLAAFNTRLVGQVRHLEEKNKEAEGEKKKLREEKIELEKKNFELEKAIRNTKTENVDGGVNSPQGEKCVSSNGQTVLLSSVSQKWKPHPRYRRPCNCLASCVMCTVVYIILELTGEKLCWTKFPREIQRRLDYKISELPKKIKRMGIDKNENQDEDQKGNENEEQNVVKCCSSLADLMTVGLIVSNELSYYSSPPITSVRELDDHIRKATKVMRKKGSRWALIKVQYPMGSGVRRHAMAIRLFEDKSNPAVCAGVYDAQAGKLWPQSDEHAKSVIRFVVHGIDEGVAEKFAEKCGVKRCTEEYLAPAKSGEALGVPHFCDHDEMSDLL